MVKQALANMKRLVLEIDIVVSSCASMRKVWWRSGDSEMMPQLSTIVWYIFSPKNFAIAYRILPIVAAQDISFVVQSQGFQWPLPTS
jgi:hypothetical protein